jgi:hypothetical protein
VLYRGRIAALLDPRRTTVEQVGLFMTGAAVAAAREVPWRA